MACRTVRIVRIPEPRGAGNMPNLPIQAPASNKSLKWQQLYIYPVRHVRRSFPQPPTASLVTYLLSSTLLQIHPNRRIMRLISSQILLVLATAIQLCQPFPFDRRQQNFRRATYSVVNVDGSSSSPTTSAIAQTVTETTSQTIASTATVTVTPSAGVIVATVDIVEGSMTTTVVITATPTITVTADPEDPTVTDLPPPIPFGDSDLPTTSTILVSSATVTASDPMPTGAGDCDYGDTWNDDSSAQATASSSLSYPTLHPTTYASGVFPSNLPTLPEETPTWYNRTEIPPYRK